MAMLVRDTWSVGAVDCHPEERGATTENGRLVPACVEVFVVRRTYFSRVPADGKEDKASGGWCDG